LETTATYGMMYGMRRTTVHLPDDLKRAIERAARGEDQSEASFIRGALERAVNEARRPQPRLPLFSSGDARLAERVDEALHGFGER
jgi:Arc/MetJ-type ribon-helix-helix transcriptional regulator